MSSLKYDDAKWSTEKMVFLAREACPGLEHGRMHVADHDVIYVRWRNGPDLYETSVAVTASSSDWFVKSMERSALARVLDVWARIPKKSKSDSPREPFNAATFYAEVRAAGGESWHDFWHALDGIMCGSKWPAFFKANPEKHADLCRFNDQRVGCIIA